LVGLNLPREVKAAFIKRGTAGAAAINRTKSVCRQQLCSEIDQGRLITKNIEKRDEKGLRQQRTSDFSFI
jgi:hypothetical protein